MLIQMLCDKIAPILRACRALHDAIIAAQAHLQRFSHLLRTKVHQAASPLAALFSSQCAPLQRPFTKLHSIWSRISSTTMMEASARMRVGC